MTYTLYRKLKQKAHETQYLDRICDVQFGFNCGDIHETVLLLS